MSFTCPTCYQTLESIETLTSHLRRYHPEKGDIQIKCETCNKVLGRKWNLKCHISRFHSDKTKNSDSLSITGPEDINTSDISTKDTEIQDSDLENNQDIDRNYYSELMKLAEVQNRNTAVIKQNSSMLLNILNITKGLVRDVESNDIHQAKKPETIKHECKICNTQYKNSNSLGSHKSRYHPYKAIIDWSCKLCNLKLDDKRGLYIHNYQSHRSSS